MKKRLSLWALPITVALVLLFAGCPNASLPGGSDAMTGGEALGVVGAINGTLVDHDGEAVADAEIKFFKTAEPEDPAAQALSTGVSGRDAAFSLKAVGEIGQATTDSHGFFIINNLTSGFYVVTFKKEGYAFGRYIVYIPTIDEIEKASGIDFKDTDSNTTIYLETDDGEEFANVSVAGLKYSFTALLEPVLYARVAGLSGTVYRQVRAGGTEYEASTVPASGVTVVATVSLPTGYDMMHESSTYGNATVEFSAVTDADGNFAIPEEMPAATAEVSTEAIYYPGEDLWYPATIINSDLALRSGTVNVTETIVPSADRPLILAYDGDPTAPISVDQDLTVTFSVEVDTLSAQISDFYGVSGPLDFDVSLDAGRTVATLVDPAGDFPDYGLGVQSVTLTGTTRAGEAISETIQVHTPEAIRIVDTNLYNAGGYYTPTAMQRLYDEPAMVMDFPINDGTITFDFDQTLAAYDPLEDYVEIYQVESGEGTAVVGDPVAATPTTSGSTLSITVDEPLADTATNLYYVAFKVRSTRPDDSFQTIRDTADTAPPAGGPATDSLFPSDVAYLDYQALYADTVDDEYVLFDTQSIRLESANVYDRDGSRIIDYDAFGTIVSHPEIEFPADGDIILTFDDTIDETQENTFSIVDVLNGTDVSFTESIVGDTVTLNPDADLRPGADYTVSFEAYASAEDTTSGSLGFTVQFAIPDFSLVDTNFGEVTYTSGVLDEIVAAAAGSGEFLVDDKIELVFTEAISTTTTDHTVELFRDSGDNGTGTVPSTDYYEFALSVATTDVANDTLVIDPVGNLDPDKVYVVRFDVQSADTDSFANETDAGTEISLSFRTSTAAPVAPAEEVTGFVVLQNAGDVSPTGTINYNAETVQVEWDRVSSPTDLTRYYFYAEILDDSDTLLETVPLYVTDTDSDGIFDLTYTTDFTNQDYQDTEVETLSLTIDLSLSIDNHFEDILGTGGPGVDTGGIFTYGTKVELYVTSSDSVGETESTRAAAGGPELKDTINPTGSFTAGALPAAGASSTLTFTVDEDILYVIDPVSFVTELGTNSGTGGGDFTIDDVRWVNGVSNQIEIDVSLAAGAPQTTGDGVQVANYSDTSGNPGNTVSLTYP